MAFGMSPFPLQFGSRYGGGAAGDPTALTPANADARFAALGLTQAGTGTTWGETGQAATPHYAVAAAKVPLAVETIGGKKYWGPIVNPAGTNLALYSSDATNAAWVKTGCTAALALGGLEHDADWEEVIDEDDFSSDTSGDWTPKSLGNGSIAVIDGDLVLTAGSTTGSYAQVSKSYDVVVGAAYRLKKTDVGGSHPYFGVLSIGATYSSDDALFVPSSTPITLALQLSADPPSPGNTTSIGGYRLTRVDAHTLLTATGNNATALQSITSTSGERVTKFWLARGSGSGTISLTQDNGSTWADVTLTDDPQPFDVAAATLANPVIGIRIATSGDSVRLYGVQHQVAARPLRPRIGPTAGSTVTTGARTLGDTLGVSPTEIDISVVVYVPAFSGDLYHLSLNDGGDYQNGIRFYSVSALGGRIYIETQVSGVAEAIDLQGVGTDQFVKLDLQVSGSAYRARVDDGSWSNGTPQIAAAIDQIAIGSDRSGVNPSGVPILAFRDNLGNLLSAAPYGWNTRLLDNWS